MDAQAVTLDELNTGESFASGAAKVGRGATPTPTPTHTHAPQHPPAHPAPQAQADHITEAEARSMAVTLREVAVLTATIVTGNPIWKMGGTAPPTCTDEERKEFTAIETRNLDNALTRYIHHKNWNEMPPGLMLTVAIVGYAAPRIMHTAAEIKDRRAAARKAAAPQSTANAGYSAPPADEGQPPPNYAHANQYGGVTMPGDNLEEVKH